MMFADILIKIISVLDAMQGLAKVIQIFFMIQMTMSAKIRTCSI